MALENALGELALDASVTATNEKLDAVITALGALQTELNQKLEQGQDVALTSDTLTALHSVNAAISNFPTDFPDATVLAKLEAIRVLLAGTLTVNVGLTDTQLRASAVAISAASLPLPANAAQDGADGSGITVPTGGSGIRGWLSGIYQKISNTLSVTFTNTSINVSNFPSSQPVTGTFFQTTQPVSDTNVGAQADSAATTDTGTFSIVAFIKRALQNWTTILARVPVNGQATAAASIPVTLSNENIQDLFITGQSAQTATINNIIPASAGTTGTDFSGYSTVVVQVVSTGTGGTYVFEGSNDPTNNYVSVNFFNQLNLGSGFILNTAATASASQIGYVIPRTFRYLRLRIATTITGGSIQAYTTATKVPFSSIALYVAQSNAANLAAMVSGTVAHSSASAGNPARVAGRVMPTTPDLTLVAGDVSDLGMTTDQQLVTKKFAPSELDWTFLGIITNSATAVPFKNAAGASIRNYITNIIITSGTLATGTDLVILDGTLTFSSQTISSNTITSSANHDLKIGDQFVPSASTITGLTAGTIYYVLTVPSATTLTLSATPNGSTLSVSGTSVTATANRILFRTVLATTAMPSDGIQFPSPLRGMPNATLSIQTVTATTTGSVYYNISGYTGF